MIGSVTSFASPSDISDIPELLSVGNGSDSDSFSSLGYGGDAESDFDSDILEISGEDIEEESDGSEKGADEVQGNPFGDRWSRLRRWVSQQIREMYANRYEMPRGDLPRGPSCMRHVLFKLKIARPNKFREELRVTPRTFDMLVAAIENDTVFQNNSNTAQMAIEEQLAITLYRFGHDGNAAGLQGVANWAAVGKGTVLLVT